MLTTKNTEKNSKEIAILKNTVNSEGYDLPRPPVSINLLGVSEESVIMVNMRVYDYTDYREFLRDFYKEQKEKHPYYSYRYFSKVAGLGGKNYLQMVIEGNRNLTAKTLQKFILAIGFKKKEAEYFEALVLFNQAKRQEDKDRYFDRLASLKPLRGTSQIEKDQYLYFTNKYVVVLREMVGLPYFKEDYEWMAAKLGNAMTPEQVKKAIKVLIRLKLLKRDEKGDLKLSHGVVKTQKKEDAIEIIKYYRSILNNARTSIIDVPHDEREIVSLTIPMPIKLMPEVKEILHESYEKIVNLINSKKAEFDEVYQLNTLLFPVTKKVEDKE